MSYDKKITGLRPAVRAGTLLPLATSCSEQLRCGGISDHLLRPRRVGAQNSWLRAKLMSCTASATLKGALLPFQREGVAAAVERWDGRILLGDEMGLGKTIQVSPTGCSVCSC